MNLYVPPPSLKKAIGRGSLRRKVEEVTRNIVFLSPPFLILLVDVLVSLGEELAEVAGGFPYIFFLFGY